ncbi:MAG: DUF4258 domain-containing protein [Anaerolineae bacterium]|nr:DUF4258 domain-containing protein [Anaerolineae bacterium]
MDILNAVRKTANKRILYLPHALTQMNLPERMITADEVREVVFKGEIIEDYPEDPRGHSCLMYGWTSTKNRPIHVVCSPKDEYLAIITAYVPSPKEWESDFKTRRK